MANDILHSDALSLIEKYESGGRNILQQVVDPKISTASGYWQITNTTWRDTAPKEGIDLRRFPTAMSAPRGIQARVADRLFTERGFEPWSVNKPLMKAVRGETISANPQNALRASLAERRSSPILNFHYSDLPYPRAKTPEEYAANRQAYSEALARATPPAQASEPTTQSQPDTTDPQQPTSDLFLDQRLPTLPSSQVRPAQSPTYFSDPNGTAYQLPVSRNDQKGQDATLIPNQKLSEAVGKLKTQGAPRRGDWSSAADGAPITEKEAEYKNDFAVNPHGFTDEGAYIEMRKRIDAQRELAKGGIISKVLSTMITPFPVNDVANKTVLAAANSFTGNAISALDPEAYQKANEAMDLGGVGNFVSEAGGGLIGLGLGLKGVGKLTEIAAAPIISRLGAGAKLTLAKFGEEGVHQLVGGAAKTFTNAFIQQAPGQAIQVAQGKKSLVEALKENALTAGSFAALEPVAEGAKILSEGTGIPAVIPRAVGQATAFAGAEQLSTGQISPASVAMGLGFGMLPHGKATEAIKPDEVSPEINVEAQQVQPDALASGNESPTDSPAAVSQPSAPAAQKTFEVVKPEEVGAQGEAVHVAKIPVEITIPKGAELKGETGSGVPTTRIRTEDIGVIHRMSGDGSAEQITTIIDGEKEANPHIVSVFNEDGSFKENVVVLKAMDAADAEQMVSNEFGANNIKATPLSKPELRSWLKSDAVDKPFISEHETRPVSTQSTENVVGVGESAAGREESVLVDDNKTPRAGLAAEVKTKSARTVWEVRNGKVEAVRGGADHAIGDTIHRVDKDGIISTAEPVKIVADEGTHWKVENKNGEPSYVEKDHTARVIDEEVPKPDPKEEPAPAFTENVKSEEPKDPFLIRHKDSNKRLEDTGNEPIPKLPAEKVSEHQAAAIRELEKNKNAGRELIDRLSKKKNSEALSPKDTELLKIEGDNRYAYLQEKRKAFNDISKENNTPEELEAAQAAFDKANDEYLEVERVDIESGSAAGKSLRARRGAAAEFTIKEMTDEAQAAKNHGRTIEEREPLTAQEHDDIAAAHAEIAELRKKVADYEAGKEVDSANKQMDKFLLDFADDLKKSKKAKKSYVSWAEEQEKMGRDFLAKNSSSLFVGIPAEHLLAVARIGVAHIARGIDSLAEFSKKMVEEFGDKIKPHLDKVYEQSRKLAEAGALALKHKDYVPHTDAEIASRAEGGLTGKLIADMAYDHFVKGTNRDDILGQIHQTLERHIPGLTLEGLRKEFTNFGKTRHPSTEVARGQVRELRQIERLRLNLEHIIKKGEAPPRTGYQRDKPSPDIRALAKEIRDKMVELGIETRSPEDQLLSRLEAKKSHLRNQVEDLDREIKSLNKAITEGRKIQPESKRKASVTLDKDAKELVEQRGLKRIERDKLYREAVDTDAEIKANYLADLARKKSAVKKATDRTNERIRNGDYEPAPKKALLPDDELMTLQGDLERAQKNFRNAREMDRRKNRDWYHKFLEGTTTLYVMEVVSSPVTMARLIVASAAREIIQRPTEEISQGVLQLVFKKFGEQTARDHALVNFFGSEKAAIKGLLNGIPDAWKNLKFESSDLDLMGIDAPQKMSKVEYVGYVHNAIKAPVFHAEFARSYFQRMLRAAQNGEDIESPHVVDRIANEAKKDALRSKLQQDNMAKGAFNQVINGWAKSKKHPYAGPLAAFVGKFFIPVAGVSSNMFLEQTAYVHGVLSGGARLAHAYIKGVEKLDPEVAEAISRQLSKGIMGAVYGYIGWNNYKKIEEFISTPQGKLFMHTAPALTIEFAATVAKYFYEDKGLVTSLAAAEAESFGHLPFVSAPAGIGAVYETAKKGNLKPLGSYFGRMGGSLVVPAFVEDIAKVDDHPAGTPFFDRIMKKPIQRSPQNLGQHILVRLPVGRRLVPKK